jgi:hypothetical protein
VLGGLILPGTALAHPVNRESAFGSYRLDTTSDVPPSNADTCLQDMDGAVWNNNCVGTPNPTADLFFRLQIQSSGNKVITIMPIGGTWSSYTPTCTVYSDSDGTAGNLVTGGATTLASATLTGVTISIPSTPFYREMYLICDGIGPNEGIASITWTD